MDSVYKKYHYRPWCIPPRLRRWWCLVGTQEFQWCLQISKMKDGVQIGKVPHPLLRSLADQASTSRPLENLLFACHLPQVPRQHLSNLMTRSLSLSPNWPLRIWILISVQNSYFRLVTQTQDGAQSAQQRHLRPCSTPRPWHLRRGQHWASLYS